MWDVKRPKKIVLGWGDKRDAWMDYATCEVWSPFLAACLINDCVPNDDARQKRSSTTVFRVYRGDVDDDGEDLSTRGFDELSRRIASATRALSKPEFAKAGGVNRSAAIEWAQGQGDFPVLCELKALFRETGKTRQAGAAMPKRDGTKKRTGSHHGARREEILRVVKLAAVQLHKHKCPSFALSIDRSLKELISECSSACQFKTTQKAIALHIEDRRTAGELRLPQYPNVDPSEKVYGYSFENILSVISGALRDRSM